jgi:hypothetical protein
MMLIGPADDLEEQFGSGLGEGNISEFIDDQEMELLELFVQSLKPFFLPASRDNAVPINQISILLPLPSFEFASLSPLTSLLLPLWF